MANINVVYKLPTTRDSGRPLDPTTLAGIELAVSADEGASWGVTDMVAPVDGSSLFTDMEIGIWHFRGVLIDKNGGRSLPAIAIVEVPDTSAPGQLTLTATLVP